MKLDIYISLHLPEFPFARAGEIPGRAKIEAERVARAGDQNPPLKLVGQKASCRQCRDSAISVDRSLLDNERFQKHRLPPRGERLNIPEDCGHLIETAPDSPPGGQRELTAVFSENRFQPALYFKMLALTNMSLTTANTCATKLAVLADPTRLAVLEFLLQGPGTVKEINGDIRVAQNLLSHHLSTSTLRFCAKLAGNLTYGALPKASCGMITSSWSFKPVAMTS